MFSFSFKHAPRNPLTPINQTPTGIKNTSYLLIKDRSCSILGIIKWRREGYINTASLQSHVSPSKTPCYAFTDTVQLRALPRTAQKRMWNSNALLQHSPSAKVVPRGVTKLKYYQESDNLVGFFPEVQTKEVFINVGLSLSWQKIHVLSNSEVWGSSKPPGSPLTAGSRFSRNIIPFIT